MSDALEKLRAERMPRRQNVCICGGETEVTLQIWLRDKAKGRTSLGSKSRTFCAECAVERMMEAVRD